MEPQASAVLIPGANTEKSSPARDTRTLSDQQTNQKLFPDFVLQSIAERLESARLGKRSLVVAKCCNLIGLSSEVSAGGHNTGQIVNLTTWLGSRFIKGRSDLRKLLED